MQRPPTSWLDCSRCGRWWWWGGGKGGRGDLQVEDLMVPWHCNWFSLMTMAIMMIVWLVCLFRWNGCNVWTGEIVISGAKFHIVQLEVWLNKEHFPLKKSNLLCNLLCLFSGHHADEMSEGSQVLKVTPCVQILKRHRVTDRPRSGIELPGQLKIIWELFGVWKRCSTIGILFGQRAVTKW